MKTDPRRILEEAAEQRVIAEVFPRSGGMVRATVIRVEQGGVVLTTDVHRLAGGEDIRVWLVVDGRAYTFDASVIRAGVPVPDRSQNGALLGFIDRWTVASEGTHDEGLVLALEPPNGPPISLLASPVRVLHLAVDGLAFTVPVDFKLIFVQQGSFRLRMAVPGRSVVASGCRVRALSHEERFILYDLTIEDVDDPDAHREVVESLAAALA